MRMRVPICSNIVVKYFHCWLNPIFFKCFYLSERHRDTDTNILLMLLNPQLSPNCQEWAIMEPIQGTREADIPAPEPWSAASQGKHQQAVGIRSGGGTQHPRHSNMKCRHHKQHFNCCARGRPLMLSSHTEHFTSLLGGDTTASHIIPSFLAHAQWLSWQHCRREGSVGPSQDRSSTLFFRLSKTLSEILFCFLKSVMNVWTSVTVSNKKYLMYFLTD